MGWLVWGLSFIALTALTQIGGAALVLSTILLQFRRTGGNDGAWPGRLRQAGAFAVVYTLLSLFFVPPLAAQLGRVALPCGIWAERAAAPATFMYCALNRHYVQPKLAALLDGLSRHMDKLHPGTRTLYLDANFPFFDGFPLLPHLSHDDGRKLDLAFYYADASGNYIPGAVRSPIGYGAFEEPVAGPALKCPGGPFSLRWNFAWLQPFVKDMELDAARMSAAMAWLVSSGREFGIEKIFMEPHLTQRLNAASPFVRFQGCRAARHDDHIHIQIRP